MHAMFVGKVVPQRFAFDLDLINDLHAVNFSVILASLTPAVLSRGKSRGATACSSSLGTMPLCELKIQI